MILELANDPRRSFETTERRIYIALRPKHCEKEPGQKALGPRGQREHMAGEHCVQRT